MNDTSLFCDWANHHPNGYIRNKHMQLNTYQMTGRKNAGFQLPFLLWHDIVTTSRMHET